MRIDYLLIRSIRSQKRNQIKNGTRKKLSDSELCKSPNENGADKKSAIIKVKYSNG